jgi:VanZ family protein
MLTTLHHPRLWQLLGWTLVASAIIASLLPGATIPNLHGNDKLMHALTYAVLALWFAGLYPRARYFWIAVLLFALGLCIEWAQGAMALGRESDYRDVLANSVGIAAGLTLALLRLGDWAQRLEDWVERP